MLVCQFQGFGYLDSQLGGGTLGKMTMKRATRVRWEAHTKGRAVAKSCHREPAGLYEERLTKKGLTTSIEPHE